MKFVKKRGMSGQPGRKLAKKLIRRQNRELRREERIKDTKALMKEPMQRVRFNGGARIYLRAGTGMLLREERGIAAK